MQVESKEQNSISSSTLKEELFECPLCQSLLLDPITTSCGHSFCKDCILRAVDHDNRCPVCRTVVHVTPDCNVSILLQNIIQECFPEQYKLRKEELEQERKSQHFNLPLFLLGSLVLYPTASLPLHVFEPRYRLMVRRCLDGGRRFGIVPLVQNELASIGTAAIIENHYVLPDGRSLVATIGGQRFKVINTCDQDNYKVAKVSSVDSNNSAVNFYEVEYFGDRTLSEEETQRMNEKFNTAKSMVTGKWAEALPQIEEKVGSMPLTPVEFGWWLASLLPISAEDKYRVLESTSAEERLDILLKCMVSLPASSSGCTIS